MLRAVRPGFLRDLARLDDRSDRQHYVPEDKDDGEPHPIGWAKHNGALEEQFGESPSSIAAEIAGLVAAADIARQNGDTTTASSWESTADSWRSSLAGWTFTTSGYWGGHQYYERIDKTSNPND